MYGARPDFIPSGRGHIVRTALRRLGAPLPGPVKQGEFTWQEPPGRPGCIAGETVRFLESPQGLAKIYREPCPDKSAALRREIAVKRLSRAHKCKLMEGNGLPWDAE